MRRLGLIIAILLVLAACGAAGAWLGYRAAVPRLAERGVAALELAADRLSGQIDRYRPLPAVLAHHPTVQDALNGGAGANEYLLQVADITGALDIYVMDLNGTTVAASNWQMDRSFLGRNFAWRPYFQRAVQGGLGFYHAVGTTSAQRGFYLAHPVQDADGRIMGVVAVKIDLGRIESSWRGDPAVAFFSDARGTIFLSNRAELVLRGLPGRQVATEGDPGFSQYAGVVPVPLPAQPRRALRGHAVWTSGDIPGLPAEALWLSRDVPTLGLTANVLVDTGPLSAQAALWGAIAAGLGGIVALAGTVVALRRGALRRQLETEERAKARLEREVADRTADLRDAVASLQDEVQERIAAEAALREVQDQLVQAGKLKALGEMSAGISHELNQPLAAIQTLADNTEILLDRGREAAVRGNLAAISKLAGRAGRIIRNLRAFARKEGEPATDVDLCEVIADALEIVAPRLRQADAEVDWAPPAVPVHARGGRVRLQMVLVNLISNAADAMAGRDGPRRIRLGVSREGEQVSLSVRDTGPGLQHADRIFDPFYTTKPTGEGLGLGLSISYGIVQSFGGDIRGENCPDGGAVFTVTLPVGAAREAAA